MCACLRSINRNGLQIAMPATNRRDERLRARLPSPPIRSPKPPSSSGSRCEKRGEVGPGSRPSRSRTRGLSDRGVAFQGQQGPADERGLVPVRVGFAATGSAEAKVIMWTRRESLKSVDGWGDKISHEQADGLESRMVRATDPLEKNGFGRGQSGSCVLHSAECDFVVEITP